MMDKLFYVRYEKMEDDEAGIPQVNIILCEVEVTPETLFDVVAKVEGEWLENYFEQLGSKTFDNGYPLPAVFSMDRTENARPWVPELRKQLWNLGTGEYDGGEE